MPCVLRAGPELQNKMRLRKLCTPIDCQTHVWVRPVVWHDDMLRQHIQERAGICAVLMQAH